MLRVGEMSCPSHTGPKCPICGGKGKVTVTWEEESLLEKRDREFKEQAARAQRGNEVRALYRVVRMRRRFWDRGIKVW